MIGRQGAIFGPAVATPGSLARDTFWALLGGFFDETLIEKLKASFDQLVGR